MGLLDSILGAGRKIKFIRDYDGVRENNFSLIRLIFALAVLFGHSYPISGNGIDPISQMLPPGYGWIGSIAVSGFFAISGFLITASYANRGLVAYSISRVLRLYPAIVVYCAFAILVLGPLAASVDLATYFQTERWDYMNNALLWSWQANLPYVFADRPLGGGTNGSMWTLPVELRSYMLVAAIGVFGVWRNRLAANVAIAALLLTLWFGRDMSSLFHGENRYLEPMVFFLFGVGFWINRDVIPLVWIFALFALACPYLFHKFPDIYRVAHPLSVCYVIFYVSYAFPAVNLEKMGDISYGAYIYAWPIQQLIWWRGQSGLENALLATLIVVPLAYASWRFVERPAMGLKAFLPSWPMGGAWWSSIRRVRGS